MGSFIGGLILGLAVGAVGAGAYEMKVGHDAQRQMLHECDEFSQSVKDDAHLMGTDLSISRMSLTSERDDLQTAVDLFSDGRTDWKDAVREVEGAMSSMDSTVDSLDSDLDDLEGKLNDFDLPSEGHLHQTLRREPRDR
jgi:hypothetical protein